MLSLIVPVFNEHDAVESTVRQLHAALSARGGDWEIVVVDDGSTDGSGCMARDLGLPRVRVVTHPQNLGNGASIKTGIRHARGEMLGTVDADGTYPIADIPRLVDELESAGADMVVGARAHDGEHIPTPHRVAKAILIRLARYLTGVRIPDINSGMRVFRRPLAERFWNLYPQGFSFHITITLGGLCNGFLVRYVPITYGKRIGRSKLSSGADGFLNFVRFLHVLLRVVSYFRPLRFFLWPAALLTAAGLPLAFAGDGRSWGMAFLMAALQMLLCGILAEVLVRTRRPAPPAPPVPAEAASARAAG